jgi:glycosyltransferase involved in cell wall biosynthesis
MYITATGTALPCCIAPFATPEYEQIMLGNVFEPPLAEVWNDRPIDQTSSHVLDRIMQCSPLDLANSGERDHMISIIIPVLNEVAIVGAALETLLQQEGDYEVIVVDGGSADGTCDIVRQFPVRLVRIPPSLPPGIGCQINQGAQQALGDVLLFLHVDVQLPPQAATHIEAALADPHLIGGGFLPTFCGPVPASERLMLALVERAWRTRTRVFRWFAGDTGPFIRRNVFWRCGGYPPTCFASDWDFADRIRRRGRLAVIREPVLVHCRRHVSNGVLKTLLVTGSVELMYRIGANRESLRYWYRTWLPRERVALQSGGVKHE